MLGVFPYIVNKAKHTNTDYTLGYLHNVNYTSTDCKAMLEMLLSIVNKAKYTNTCYTLGYLHTINYTNTDCNTVLLSIVSKA